MVLFTLLKSLAMDNKQLPAEVVEEIKKNAEAKTAIENERIIGDSKDYGRRISYLDGYEAGCIELGTEYATKLHQVEQENAQLKQWKSEASELLNPILDYGQSKEADIPLGASISDTVIERCKKFDQASKLLEKFISRHEAGLLPDRFIYQEIKQFLDGK